MSDLEIRKVNYLLAVGEESPCDCWLYDNECCEICDPGRYYQYLVE